MKSKSPVWFMKKEMDSYSLIKKLGKIFPKQAMLMEGLSGIEISRLEQMGLIQVFSNDLVTARDRKFIGKASSFSLTPLGLKYVNEMTLKKINKNILILTWILVTIGLFQSYLFIIK